MFWLFCTYAIHIRNQLTRWDRGTGQYTGKARTQNLFIMSLTSHSNCPNLLAPSRYCDSWQSIFIKIILEFVLVPISFIHCSLDFWTYSETSNSGPSRNHYLDQKSGPKNDAHTFKFYVTFCKMPALCWSETFCPKLEDLDLGVSPYVSEIVVTVISIYMNNELHLVNW